MIDERTTRGGRARDRSMLALEYAVSIAAIAGAVILGIVSR
jgi:hypothetical protein